MCKDLSFRRTLQSTSSARHKTVKPLIHHGWTEWQRKNRQLRHTSDFNLQRLIEKPALGSKWCLPRKKITIHSALRAAQGSNVNHRPLCWRRTESCPPSLPPCPQLFLTYTLLWSIMYSPGAAPPFILICPPTERQGEWNYGPPLAVIV